MSAPNDQRAGEERAGADTVRDVRTDQERGESGDRTPRRREFLAGAAVTGLGLLWTASRHGWVDPARAAAVAERAGASCTLSRELTEGPYWIDTKLTRRDITEDRNGVPIRIVFTVQDASTCRVIPGADVEIWHADAEGEYSGFDGDSSSRYLRGHQKANAKGKAVFDTIYPGWYRGRTPHIHLKVHVGGNEVHTGQLFFRDSLSDAVYRTRYYRARGSAETTNAEDGIYDSGSRLAVRRRRAGGYLGRMTLNVER
jgi:protocatechuate 3,4-dioxygenase beta subunit